MDVMAYLLEVTPGLAGRAAQEARKRGQFNRARAIEYLSKKLQRRSWQANIGSPPPPSVPPRPIAASPQPVSLLNPVANEATSMAKKKEAMYAALSKAGKYKYPLAGVAGAGLLAAGAYKLGKSRQGK